MPSKDFTLEDGLPVTVYKRRGNRNLRLSISAAGQVRVSIPAWAPYGAGLKFAWQRRDWIREQRQPAAVLVHGQAVGKAHHLEFIAKDIAKPAGRVYDTSIVISYPAGLEPGDPVVQQAAETACVRALRSQAERLLPQRLATLASAHGFKYGQVSVKRLKGRWGSCDQHANIVLNLFLMQLPWDLIDYVLLHELAHTKVLKHGPDFWSVMEAVLPNAKARRKTMRGHQPVLNGAG